jgi:guanine deaminase
MSPVRRKDARVVRGATLSFRADPRGGQQPRAYGFEEKGAVAIEEGRIVWCGPFDRLPQEFASAPCDDYGAALVLPGLIDAHIHFPQYRMLAAPGRDLLDWLNRFAFPEEARYSDAAYAMAAAEVFLDRLLEHGTTTALAFSSVHSVCAEALFAAAERRGIALLTGKTMMDRNAPQAVLDDPETGVRESEALLQKWHGRGRLGYAITPRFAVTSSEAQLRLASELCRTYPQCLMQTHLAESAGEIAAVKAQFPWAKDYTDVYDRCGLLGRKSFFAHGVHLSERECVRLAESGSTVVHCPTANTFLGSGLFDIDHVGDPRRPVGIAIATDVGGGTGYSMLATLGDAYKVAQLKGRRLRALEAFYMATLGNALRLELDREIGSLEPGKWADLVVLDPWATPVLASRQEVSESLEDVLFSLIILGDDRAVRATYVAGRRCKQRNRNEGTLPPDLKWPR